MKQIIDVKLSVLQTENRYGCLLSKFNYLILRMDCVKEPVESVSIQRLQYKCINLTIGVLWSFSKI